MLKFERESNSHNVTIRLRDKEKLLSPSFYWALAIALTLHFAGLLIFQIQPFRINHQFNEIPPAEVSIEGGFDLFDGTVITDLENHQKKQRHPLSPPAKSPKLPTLPVQIFKPSFNQNPIITMRHNLVSLIEDIIDIPGPKEIAVTSYQPIEITPLGNLSKLKVYPSITSSVQKGSPSTFVSIIYDIQIKDGTPFWFLQKNLYGDQNLKSEADQILKKLQFEGQGIDRGSIEIVLRKDSSCLRYHPHQH